MPSDGVDLLLSYTSPLGGEGDRTNGDAVRCGGGGGEDPSAEIVTSTPPTVCFAALRIHLPRLAGEYKSMSLMEARHGL